MLLFVGDVVVGGGTAVTELAFRNFVQVALFVWKCGNNCRT
jgi:hypothetical protein